MKTLKWKMLVIGILMGMVPGWALAENLVVERPIYLQIISNQLNNLDLAGEEESDLVYWEDSAQREFFLRSLVEGLELLDREPALPDNPQDDTPDDTFIPDQGGNIDNPQVPDSGSEADSADIPVPLAQGGCSLRVVPSSTGWSSVWVALSLGLLPLFQRWRSKGSRNSKKVSR